MRLRRGGRVVASPSCGVAVRARGVPTTSRTAPRDQCHLSPHVAWAERRPAHVRCVTAADAALQQLQNMVIGIIIIVTACPSPPAPIFRHCYHPLALYVGVGHIDGQRDHSMPTPITTYIFIIFTSVHNIIHCTPATILFQYGLYFVLFSAIFMILYIGIKVIDKIY